MIDEEAQNVIQKLQSNWIWVDAWIDSSSQNTAGRIVRFKQTIEIASVPSTATIHLTADTRYKLQINGERVAVGPARSSPNLWYYDTLDIAPFLRVGKNDLCIIVIRYFVGSRHAMPFVRSPFPGLTVVGGIEQRDGVVNLGTSSEWIAEVDDSIQFPTGLIDDVFLHIYERKYSSEGITIRSTRNLGIKTLNGELAPWRLHPRTIPMPEQTAVPVSTITACTSASGFKSWQEYLSGAQSLSLPGSSTHTLEILANVHSTAFLKWTFKSAKGSSIKLKVTYSEGYELEPRAYPFFRTKANRLDSENGNIIGPYDEVVLDIPASEIVTYEPFWFRTFHVIKLEITIGPHPVDLLSFSATQVNYPLNVKASWKESGDAYSEKIWDVSIRTMRNCMFDGYSDCPFYEQLQYGGDSYPVGLFHYLLSGDDRLMRQAITNFAYSITPEGLTQSRFPSHVPQIIAGFSLYWILQVCKHHLFFGDTQYARSFLPRIDGVLDFFDRHVDDLGLIGGLSSDVWQFVDWVTTWGATDEHPDKGVPTSGRKTNRHTFFSLLYAYVLKQAAQLTRDVGRPGHASEYEARSESVLEAVRKHCYDGSYFTDSTADVADDLSYSQHCQVFAVLSGVASTNDRVRLLEASRTDPRFSKCSYFMQFYALRAYALAGDEMYNRIWPQIWDPWRKMLANNMTTWEEDDVRQRSDCHAWGSVPVYEYCTELAGVQPISKGCTEILFKPRLGLSDAVTAKVALGKHNCASVSWMTDDEGSKHVVLTLEEPVRVSCQLPGEERRDCGFVRLLEFTHRMG